MTGGIENYVYYYVCEEFAIVEYQHILLVICCHFLRQVTPLEFFL